MATPTRRVARLSNHVAPGFNAGPSWCCATSRPHADGPYRANLRRFDGQICVVTGGASGIGLAACQNLCREGAKILCIFDVADATATVDDLREAHPQVHVCAKKVDLASDLAAQEAYAEVIARFGRIDVFVQAAGITGRTNLKSHEVDIDDFEKVLKVNTTALFIGMKAVLPVMLKTGYGRIVNIASISGKDGNAGMLAYSTSKAAVIGMTKSAAKDYAALGKDITINCVAPAVVQTQMVDKMPPETVNYMTARVPMGRTCRLDEVSEVISFAASPGCSFTTGFCFDCTGGRAVY